jgi:inner membrane protein
VWAGIAFLALLLLPRRHPSRKWWSSAGIVLSLVFIIYSGFNKLKIDSEVKAIAAQQQIPYTRYFTTPTPFNNWLWYIVMGNDKGYYVGYRSVFDKEKRIDFEYFPRQDSLLGVYKDDKDADQLIRFSNQFYTVEHWNDTLIFNDLRFGQILGWEERRGRFAFHYFLNHPDENDLVVQRGRFAKWDKESLRFFIQRMKGK